MIDATYPVNKHMMSVLQVVGVAGTNNLISRSRNVCWRTRQRQVTCERSRKLTCAVTRPPSVVIIDNEQALVNALVKPWLLISVHQCRWLISKNIKARYFKPRMSSLAFNVIMKAWHQNYNIARMANEFDLSWSSVKANFLDPA